MNERPDTIGNFVENDEIPETLIPVLKRMFLEHWPFVKTTIETIQSWAKDNPNTEIPRMIGEQPFKIGVAEGNKAVATFTQWKAQRILDTYNGFEGDDKASVDDLLRSTGGYDSMQLAIDKRIKRVNNTLVFEN
jgi:hypothetical protein